MPEPCILVLLHEKRLELCTCRNRLFTVHNFHAPECEYRKWGENHCKDEEKRNGGAEQ